MAISLESPTYKLTFTDGTFITLLNSNSDVSHVYEGGEYTFILPNYYIGDFDTWLGSVTKYDKNGNKYEFSNMGVIINDTQDFRRTGNKMAFSYDPVEDKLYFNYIYPPPELLPSLNTNDRAVYGTLYNGDTSGTAYNSIGEAIATGEDFYDRLSYGWYSISNILTRNDDIPFHGANAFCGNHNERTLTQLIWNSSGTGALVDINNFSELIEDFDPEPEPIPDDDPYTPGDDETQPGGGDGDHDNGSDPIDFPSLPSVSAVDTGFITLFNPSLRELQDLSDYLWSPLFDVDTVKKLFADPMDVFLGLSIVPVQVPNGSSKTVKVAGISTGISMTLAASQYVEVDCGSINVKEFWGAYLDYEPYTKAELYLPYIGTHPISIDDIMGKTITIKYHVDILSGACVAYVKCGNSILYSFIGQCSSSIPINSSDWTNVINGALTIATAIGTMVATGGASAPMASGASGEAGAAAAATAREASKTAAMIRGASTIASTAVNVMKPSIEKSGSISGTGGMMAVQKPYLIITRPRQAVPGSQNHFMGYPSFITSVIGTLSGYTEVEEVHLEGIPATDSELAEIESLLRGGVYL